MSRMSKKVDGIAFEAYRARFTGTIDLEDTEAEVGAIGENLVMVVVATVDDFTAKLDKDGDLARITVFKATDARVLDDELKTLLVERLGLYGGDTVEPVLIVPGERRVEVEVETGEIVVEDDSGDQQMSFEDVVSKPQPEGPRTVPFNTMPSFAPESSVTVGVVGSGNEDWRNIDG